MSDGIRHVHGGDPPHATRGRSSPFHGHRTTDNGVASTRGTIRSYERFDGFRQVERVFVRPRGRRDAAGGLCSRPRGLRFDPTGRRRVVRVDLWNSERVLSGATRREGDLWVGVGLF